MKLVIPINPTIKAAKESLDIKCLKEWIFRLYEFQRAMSFNAVLDIDLVQTKDLINEIFFQ